METNGPNSLLYDRPSRSLSARSSRSLITSPRQVALYTASQIEPGEELYVHYGKSYEPRRDYAVGAAACVRKCDISLAQMPANVAWLPNLPPHSWMPRL